MKEHRFTSCRFCGSPLWEFAPGATGDCLRCLMEFTLSTEPVVMPKGDEVEERMTFAQYDLLEEISRGGMGVVYRAYDRTLGRLVALKMLAAGRLLDQKVIDRFQREARTMALLDHPNIIPIYETGEHDGQHFFAMRLIEETRPFTAMSLNPAAGLISDKKQEGYFLDFLIKVVRAVSYAHERGVIHCDLKPSNILIADNGEPLVADFGLARVFLPDEGYHDHTRVVAGTPSYMAPEQVNCEREITVATDLYGLGTIMYELLCGRPPHVGKSSDQVLLAIVGEPIEPIRSQNPSVSRELETIALRCLRKDPSERYPSVAALADELERYQRGESIQARPTSFPEFLFQSVRRYSVQVALSCVLLITMLIGFVSFARQSQTNASLRETIAQMKLPQSETLVDSKRDELPFVEVFCAGDLVVHSSYSEEKLFRTAGKVGREFSPQEAFPFMNSLDEFFVLEGGLNKEGAQRRP